MPVAMNTTLKQKIRVWVHSLESEYDYEYYRVRTREYAMRDEYLVLNSVGTSMNTKSKVRVRVRVQKMYLSKSTGTFRLLQFCFIEGFSIRNLP